MRLPRLIFLIVISWTVLTGDLLDNLNGSSPHLVFGYRTLQSFRLPMSHGFLLALKSDLCISISPESEMKYIPQTWLLIGEKDRID